MASNKYYEMLEDAPAKFESIVNLFRWSENYTFKDSPLRVFLHAVGWMEDHMGDVDLIHFPVLGYLELAMLGDALVAYANFGEEADEFVHRLMEADLESEDAHLYEEYN